MTVTEGHDEGIENLRFCVINKTQREWKKLRQLDNKPKFEDVRAILKNHQNVSPKIPNQFTTQQEWTKLRHLDNKPKFDDVRIDLKNHQKVSSKIPKQFTTQQKLTKLRHLDNKPKFDDVIIDLKNHQKVSSRIPNQFTTQQEWKKLRHLDNKPKFEDVRVILKNHQKVSPKIPNQFTTEFHHPKSRMPLNNRISITPFYLPNPTLKVQYPDASITAKHVFVLLKLILFLITFVNQVGSTVIQKHTCGFYSAAIISLILFICLLTLGRFVYCLFLVKLETSDYIPFCCTLAIVFFLEIPMMISNAFVVNSCGRVEALTLSLHIGYIGHLWLALIMDTIYMKLNAENCGFLKFFKGFLLSFILPVVMYVPIYLKLGERAYVFHLDIKKIGGESTTIGRLVRNLLIYIGTIGWGVWCAGFLVCVVGFLYCLCCCSRKCGQSYEAV